MFADLHLQKQRVVAVVVRVSDNKGYVTGVPMSMREFENSLRVMPTPSRLKSLARKLLVEDWVLTIGEERSRVYLKIHQPSNVMSRPLAVEGIVATVWQYNFDADALELNRTRLMEERIMAGGG